MMRAETGAPNGFAPALARLQPIRFHPHLQIAPSSKLKGGTVRMSCTRRDEAPAAKTCCSAAIACQARSPLRRTRSWSAGQA
jgi:hypothetical protein